MRIIPNEDLQMTDIPDDVSDWGKFIEFALTFNGYEAAGSLQKCVEIGKAHNDKTLTDLRTCLFYEARKNYWTGGYGPNVYDPDEETARYINETLEKIRKRVDSGDI